MKMKEFCKRFIIATIIVGTTWGFCSLLFLTTGVNNEYLAFEKINEYWYAFLLFTILLFVIAFFLLSKEELNRIGYKNGQ